MRKSAIVVGAGIAGLATARALAVRGYEIVVIERSERAVGASIRNFGMIWMIGQPAGELYERAILSRSIWKQVLKESGIWHDEVGSLHVAHHADEWAVLQEFFELESARRGCSLLSAQEVLKISPATSDKNLMGGLFSPNDMIIDPRQAIGGIAEWLKEKYGVRFIWGRAVTDICYPCLYSGKDQWEADEIYVCSGADFETLYPDIFSKYPLTKCKLQMIRLEQPAEKWLLGPALCGGLTLGHYQSFAVTSSLAALKKRLEDEYPEYLKCGIHVMVSQNQTGELTVGDSHEYGLTPDPFDKHFINQMILDYLKGFTHLGDQTVLQTWNGVYPKFTNGQTDLILRPEEGVTIVNGFGGSGMTMAFGLCEELMRQREEKSNLLVMSH